jgi:broad specificity phosphatase PhoE
MRRLLLIRHGSTDAVRAAAFGADEPLDASGQLASERLHARLPSRIDEVLVSPTRRARETAVHAGLEISGEDAALAECDFGRWAGKTLADIVEEDPTGVEAWMSDPAAAPHGGESMSALLVRVGEWLAGQATQSRTAVVITHAGVVKAALVDVLGAPPAAFWRIDVSPLGITELHAHDGRWTVTRVNHS